MLAMVANLSQRRVVHGSMTVSRGQPPPSRGEELFARRASLPRAAALLLALAVLLLVAGCSRGPAAPSPSATADLPAAPDFSFTVYQGEKALGSSRVRLSSLRGKPIVLNFFAGLCPPCRVEMPDLQKLHERLQDRVLVLGIDVGPFTGLGSLEEGRALVRELNITYPIGAPPDQKAMVDFRVIGMPTTVFLTPDLRIYRKWTGLLTKEKLDSLVEELLAASKGP